MVTITFSCCFICYLKVWFCTMPLFLTFLILNFHSYNTIILSFILYHLLRPAFFLYPSQFSKRNLHGCRAEIRTRSCLTAPQARPLIILCLNILFRRSPYFFPILKIIIHKLLLLFVIYQEISRELPDKHNFFPCAEAPPYCFFFFFFFFFCGPVLLVQL